MKQIIIIGLIILLSVSSVSAGDYSYVEHFDGNGIMEYPNNGYVCGHASRHNQPIGSTGHTSPWYQPAGNTMYYKSYGSCSASASTGNRYTSSAEFIHGHVISCDITNNTCFKSFYHCYSSSSAKKIHFTTSNFNYYGTSSAYVIMYVKTTPLLNLTVSGNTCDITSVDLYINDTGDYYKINSTTLDIEGDDYDFYITDGFDYRLIFSDDHIYNFTTTTNNITYDRNLCDQYTLNFLDNCANLLIDPTISIFRNTSELIYYSNDNPVSLTIPHDVNISDFLDIIIWTCDGSVMYSDYVEIIEKDLYHPTVSWNLNVHVVDDNTSTNISQAKVTRVQDCCIVGTPSGYALTQTNGRVIFTELANSNINLTVEKSGYNTYSKTLNVESVFNCWSDGGCITVRLNSTADSSDEGLSEGCGIYFKNIDGTTTNTINDTDAYVDMYYYSYIGNATLKFQHQIYTYWYTDVEYSITKGSSGYHRILNANFSDYTNSYRGYIYNVSTECNNIQTLNVINQTYEEETHYENLTSHCWIWDKLSGNEIDYRSDVKCVIYANSTNSTLLDITANFMNGTTLVDSKVLNWADFVSGSPKWYYTWYPDYDYTTGYNYTLNITGFNDYQLDTDEVWTSDITGNELTVFVKDNYNQQISYTTIFIEDWGSIATGTHNYATVTGLSDGDYQYKATKSGYISSGWATITLTEHESVTCILIALEETSVIGQKMSDADIKSMFIPMMYILFIFMLLGAFMYANR